MRNYFADMLPSSYEGLSQGYSSEAKELSEMMFNAILHFYDPQTRSNPIKRFNTLTATWKQANPFSSSIINVATHPAYQEIIGMGPIAIPLILKALKVETDHWFWALKSITGEDPVKENDRGDLEKMKQAWLDWGSENGYI